MTLPFFFPLFSLGTLHGPGSKSGALTVLKMHYEHLREQRYKAPAATMVVWAHVIRDVHKPCNTDLSRQI
eukprot:12408194-Karenia_brevis.AAC.1